MELVTAFIELGRHGAPGPYVETVSAGALLPGLGEHPLASRWLPDVAGGGAVISLAVPPSVRYALDADAAGLVLVLNGTRLAVTVPQAARSSLDPARRLFAVAGGEDLGPVPAGTAAQAWDVGVLACAAQLVGLGQGLLKAAVGYAKTRRRFGRPVGEFQAVKHHLADALVGLEYARPLVYGAALSYGTPDFSRDASAAKAAASEAAYTAAKVALQVHGAIGYTDEYAPSLLIRKARALRSAWGAPAEHRTRVMACLTGG